MRNKKFPLELRMQKNWKKALCGPETSIRSVIEIIEKAGLQVCIITDSDRNLLGTVTDGDIRRAILKRIDIDDPVSLIMNSTPVTGAEDLSPAILKNQMIAANVHQIPIVNGDGQVIGMSLLEVLASNNLVRRDNCVVLMAGGLGTRLQPLTDSIPKPLLPVGEKPILETTLEKFIEQNFHNFYISVNYKAETIKQHFEDGKKWGVTIHYLEEKTQLGTAGALQLLPKRPKEPLLVMNGDLLTNVNFHDLLQYHDEQDSMATICVREYDFQVPFGVVDIEDHRIKKIDEKPVFGFFVNAGIYVIDPAIVDLIPKGKKIDMTKLFDQLIDDGHKTTVFPIHEYWIDVGLADDLDRANADFETNFNS